MYRGVLVARGRATHSLANELDLCESYLSVERVRFADRLRTTVTLDPSLDPGSVEVPLLLLQPFVENAVRHGLRPRAGEGTITLSVHRAAEGITVDIEDDGIGLGKSTCRGNGIAVANCRERLALVYGQDARVEIRPRAGGGTRVHMELPRAGDLRAVA
jgi:LytS/YehU family sensor histidine kinase